MAFSLKRILRKLDLRDDYIRVEVDTSAHYWLSNLSYSKYVIKALKKEFPQLDVISLEKGRVNRVLPYLDFPGRIIKLSPNVPLKELKEKCMKLEKNSLGKRISDIDIFYKCGEKISRKKPCYRLWEN